MHFCTFHLLLLNKILQYQNPKAIANFYNILPEFIRHSP
jgi:hypothetical protein